MPIRFGVFPCHTVRILAQQTPDCCAPMRPISHTGTANRATDFGDAMVALKHPLVFEQLVNCDKVRPCDNVASLRGLRTTGWGLV